MLNTMLVLIGITVYLIVGAISTNRKYEGKANTEDKEEVRK